MIENQKEEKQKSSDQKDIVSIKNEDELLKKSNIKSIWNAEDDWETIFQKCKISIENEPIPKDQTKINDFFKPVDCKKKWTKRDEVHFFGNDKRKKEEDNNVHDHDNDDIDSGNKKQVVVIPS